MDFYDLKGILVTLFEGLRLVETAFEPGSHPSFHPGKCARVTCGGQPLGVLGELHPKVRLRYDLPAAFKAPILAAEIDLDRLLALVPDLRQTAPVPTLPPVFEDLALVVEEHIPAGKVQDLIRQAGGILVSEVRLFDVYRGGSLGVGMKSLAFRLTFQSQDKTLTDKDVAGVRGRILKRLEQEINARLRG
jgi:phenylalanyl-tRNA synthetase beta chain